MHTGYMKKTSSILSVSLAALLLPAALPVRAQTLAISSSAANTNPATRGTISVNGTAQVLVVPAYWQSRSGGYAMQNNISIAGSSNEPSSEASNQTFAPGQIRISAVVLVQFETLPGTEK